MSDIFISYAREDLDAARRLAGALETQGWSVFWDRTIAAGKTWREVIGSALADARCVIVLWSQHSVNSHWVLEEADQGLKRRILIPAFIENVAPPLGFGSIQAADLAAWGGTDDDPAIQEFFGDVSGILGPSPATQEAQRRQAEAEARHQAEEQQRQQAEAAAKRKALEDDHRRAETEAMRRSEEQRNTEAAAKQHEDDEQDHAVPHRGPSDARRGYLGWLAIGAISVLVVGALWYAQNQQQGMATKAEPKAKRITSEPNANSKSAVPDIENPVFRDFYEGFAARKAGEPGGDGDDADHGWLGVNVQDATAEIAEAAGLQGETGAVVQEVSLDSAAERAGIAVGDIILSINGDRIDSAVGLSESLRQMSVGESVDVELFRSGKRESVTAILSEEPTSGN